MPAQVRIISTKQNKLPNEIIGIHGVASACGCITAAILDTQFLKHDGEYRCGDYNHYDAGHHC